MPPEIKTPDNFEIDQALKEFEAKDQAEQTQKVAEVEKDSEAPKVVGLMMKWSGLSQQQAEYVLLGFAIIAICISLYLLFFGVNSPKMLSPDMIQKINEYKAPTI